MTLTSRGWAVAGMAAGLVLIWYLFGETEIGVVAFVLLGALVISMLWVGLRRPTVTLRRRIHPEAIHAGSEATIDLAVANLGGTLHGVRLLDLVEGLGAAEFLGGRLGRGTTCTATYRVLARRRGIYPVGPTRVQLEDPFGLSARIRRSGDRQELVVYPAIEDLAGPLPLPGRERTLLTSRGAHGSRGGDEFYTLREYRHGDDVKQIHWPSTARMDRLMTRQMRERRDAGALVILDTRPRPYPDEESFELAVVGAASVVVRLAAEGFDVRLISGVAAVAVGHDHCLERLAVVEQAPSLRPELLAGQVATAMPDGVAIVVTGRPDPVSLGLVREARRSGLVMATAGEPETTATGGVIFLGTDRSWARVWREAQERLWMASSAL